MTQVYFVREHNVSANGGASMLVSERYEIFNSSLDLPTAYSQNDDPNSGWVDYHCELVHSFGPDFSNPEIWETIAEEKEEVAQKIKALGFTPNWMSINV